MALFCPEEAPRPILIAGPTASGKSALALRLAEASGGVVINADSQQVYRDWQVLSARPTAEETARAEHRLYGHVALGETYSVGDWLRNAAPLIAEARAAGRRAVVVGGTGLYFKALTEGIAPIPQVPPAIRAEGEARLTRLGLPALAEAVSKDDPVTAAAIDLANPMRVLRAWEVLAFTGRGLAAWQAETAPPELPLAEASVLALAPPRDWLYARCEARLDAMIAGGALEEVRAAVALGLPEEAPGLKVLGAAELSAHLAGRLSLEAAAAAAKTVTRRYAKRQLTWVRNQMRHWRRVEAVPCAALLDQLAAEIGSGP